MENHPIPQDVTGFQFKLVGNMTLKQFAYVGAGVVIAVIFYYAPLFWLIKYSAIFFFTLLGLAVAFLPVEGRPLDLMATNFFKALVRPNQYVYRKIGGKLSFSDLNLQPVQVATASATQQTTQRANYSASPAKEERLREFLSDLSNQPRTAVDDKESAFINSLFAQNPAAGSRPMSQPKVQPFPQAPQPQMYMQPAPPPAPRVQMAPTPQPPMPMPQPIQITPPPPPVMQPMTPPMAETPAPQPIAQPTQLPPLPTTVSTTPAAPPPPPPPVEAAPPVQQTAAKQPSVTPLPATSEFPNLISGIVKDSRGNVLSGILVEVRNKDGESVRAFKTNALGQFASATQLPNGTFTVEFEDPKKQHAFEKVQIEMNGGIIPPFQVVSVDQREELRRQLFG